MADAVSDSVLPPVVANLVDVIWMFQPAPVPRLSAAATSNVSVTFWSVPFNVADRAGASVADMDRPPPVTDAVPTTSSADATLGAASAATARATPARPMPGRR